MSLSCIGSVGKCAVGMQGEPTIVVAVCFKTLLRSIQIQHTRKAAEGSYNHQSQHTVAISRPPPPLFDSPRPRVLTNIGKLTVVRQGQPTIVVAVFQNIARVHGTPLKGYRP